VPVTPGSGEPPDVIPSEVDADYDCVRMGATAPDGVVAAPPPGGDESDGPTLCPDGYVPRRRRRPYRSVGKRIVTDGPPEHNPAAPPP